MPCVAPLPDVPNVLKVTLQHEVGSDVNARSRFFVSYTGSAPTDAECATVASSIRAAWATDVKAQVAQVTTLIETTVQDLTTPSSGIGSDTTHVVGTGDATDMPGGLAVVLSPVIGRRYRGGHPRVYLPYLTPGNLSTPQTWNPTQLGDLLSAWLTFISAVLLETWSGGATSACVNISYFEGFTNFTYPSGRVKAIPKLRVAGPITDIVSTWKANPAPASQRRRNLTP